MAYTVSYKTYLSKETTRSLKRLLDKAMPSSPDLIVANGNEIVIIPQGAYEA